ncbi:MAG: hypothetical protein QXH24_00560 [Candidatus Bathyarchaeia archaeon]
MKLNQIRSAAACPIKKETKPNSPAIRIELAIKVRPIASHHKKKWWFETLAKRPRKINLYGSDLPDLTPPFNLK